MVDLPGGDIIYLLLRFMGWLGSIWGDGSRLGRFHADAQRSFRQTLGIFHHLLLGAIGLGLGLQKFLVRPGRFRLKVLHRLQALGNHLQSILDKF